MRLSLHTPMWTCRPTWMRSFRLSHRSCPVIATLRSAAGWRRQPGLYGARNASRLPGLQRPRPRRVASRVHRCSNADSRPCGPTSPDGFCRCVEDDGWFFDTELLVLAERSGLRIHEVPVDWVDDPDTRVDVVATGRQTSRAFGEYSGTLAISTT